MTTSMLHSLSDRELVEEFRRHPNGKAFELLYGRYSSLVFGVCLKYLKDRDAAREGVLCVFEKALDAWCKHEVKEVAAWLNSVARNYCLMELRAARRRQQRHLKYAVAEERVEEAVFALPEDVQWSKRLDAALAQLSEPQRSVVQHYYFGKKTYNEVADLMHMPVQEVKSALQNARRNLRQWFGVR